MNCVLFLSYFFYFSMKNANHTHVTPCCDPVWFSFIVTQVTVPHRLHHLSGDLSECFATYFTVYFVVSLAIPLMPMTNDRARNPLHYISTGNKILNTCSLYRHLPGLDS